MTAHSLALREPHAPIDRAARTAVIMPICNENVATVFAGLRATCESLAATGALSLFDIYVLSDTADPALRAAEQQAWQRLRQTLGDSPVGAGGRVFYRWRRRRTRRKAGNVADFCRRWGSQLPLHGGARRRQHHARRHAGVAGAADGSRTRAPAWCRRCRKASATAPCMRGCSSLPTASPGGCSRWAWPTGSSANRTTGGTTPSCASQPFMRHCGLAPIPGRGGLAGEILSHDFVEAALMRRAGYEVWLAPQLQGSWEQHPANLLEELQRDRRWCQGNLQNARLHRRTRLAPGAPRDAGHRRAVVPDGAGVAGLRGAGTVASAPSTPSSSGLWVLTLLLLLLPRVLGVLAVQLRGEQAIVRWHGTAVGQRHAGTAAVGAAGAAAHAGAQRLRARRTDRAAAGLEVAVARCRGRGLARRDVAHRRAGLAGAGLALLMLALHGADVAAPHLAPLLLPLLLAVPFTVWTAGPKLGQALRRVGLLSVPEERDLPRALSRGAQQHGFIDLKPQPVVAQRRRPAMARSQLTAMTASVAAACRAGAVAANRAEPRTFACPALSKLRSTPHRKATSRRWSTLASVQSIAHQHTARRFPRVRFATDPQARSTMRCGVARTSRWPRHSRAKATLIKS